MMQQTEATHCARLNRWRITRLIAVACCFSLAGALHAATPRNVLMIIVDDLMPRLGCYGDKTAITPNLDALADSGVLFERAYCQYPICNPSRSSLMSGLRPDTTGIYGNNQPAHVALSETLVLNRYFMEQGFHTVGIGKIYHASNGPANTWSKPYSTTEWLDHVAPGNRALAEVFFNRKKSKGLPDSFEAEDVPDNAYCDGKAADQAVREIAAAAERAEPLLLIAGFRHPHLPWCAPKKYYDLYDRAALPLASNHFFPKGAPEIALKQGVGELGGYRDMPRQHPLSEAQQRQSIHAYLACVSYVDAQVGRLIAALKEHKLYEDTAIVLWSDHGYQLGEHKTWAKGVNWETSHRLPLFLRVPGRGKAGQRINALVELLDVYPTLCEAVGLPIPEHCEGRSLLPFLDNPEAPRRGAAFSQLKKGNVMGRSMRTDRYRFTRWTNEASGKVEGLELYDLRDDPQGDQNLAYLPQHADALAHLEELHKTQWPKKTIKESKAP